MPRNFEHCLGFEGAHGRTDKPNGRCEELSGGGGAGVVTVHDDQIPIASRSDPGFHSTRTRRRILQIHVHSKVAPISQQTPGIFPMLYQCRRRWPNIKTALGVFPCLLVCHPVAVGCIYICLRKRKGSNF